MVYVVTLAGEELTDIRSRLRAEQRLTKAFNKGEALPEAPRVVLVVRDGTDEGQSRTLAWLGVAVHRGKIGAVDDSLTVDHLRECTEDIPLDGNNGLLCLLSDEVREEIEQSFLLGSVRSFGRTTWEAMENELRRRHPNLTLILDWLGALADPPGLSNDAPEDQAWQAQRDAVGTIARIFKVPPTIFSAWKRPLSRHAPYLAGLIPEPVEQSLIEHDARTMADSSGLFSEWIDRTDARCDIHVFRDETGRTLEIANVNATEVEARLGTDMIYFHEPTASFVLVQYKRLHPDRHTMSVDARLLRQLDRLENVARLGKPAARPEDWRLGTDPCFLKLAYWPDKPAIPADSLAPGMYLPVSYARLLLENDCTLSGRTRDNGENGRMLGYDQVPRHLVNTQFIELVQHGLVGTIGVTVEQLRALVEERVQSGHDTVVGVERSRESARARQKRVRDRSSARRPITHEISRTTSSGHDELTLFPSPPRTDSATTENRRAKTRSPKK